MILEFCDSFGNPPFGRVISGVPNVFVMFYWVGVHLMNIMAGIYRECGCSKGTFLAEKNDQKSGRHAREGDRPFS